MPRLPFNRPYLAGREIDYVREATLARHLAGDGSFSRRCQAWLEREVGCPKALLTHSCTAALEMAALLLDIAPGDEVLMPSFTFVSTANAFVLRGGVPVFVDIRPDTLNIDEARIESALGPRTRAIVVVHYAGVGCAMDAILEIGRRRGIPVVEDAAQGILARWRGQPLGSFGALGAVSFHETKNLQSGEGGALLINDPTLIERAEVLREKGTDRSRFIRGQVDKYTWVDVGSSYLPSEILAAFLWAQLEQASAIVEERLGLWRMYHEALAPLEQAGRLERPRPPAEAESNGHIYYVMLPDAAARDRTLARLVSAGVHAAFHYIPLHASPAGRRFGRTAGPLPVTEAVATRLLRLPLWIGMTADDVARAVEALESASG